MTEHSITLVVVRWDGTIQRTRLTGYLAETLSDKAFTEAKKDSRTAFAMTALSDGGFRQHYVMEPNSVRT